MKQQTFESRYRAEWESFEELLDSLEPPKSKLNGVDLSSFTSLYRRVCHFLSVAKQRRYSSHLIDYLNDLVIRGHQQLYQKKRPYWQPILKFVLADFPILLREHARYFWVATLLFYVPLFSIFLFIWAQPNLVYSVMDPAQVLQMEDMYNPALKTIGKTRESDSDVLMFGYYIKNNIGIAFQTYAAGIVYTLGSIFFLVFNGVVIGAVMGHMHNVNFHETFFPFVVGHGSFELTAITIAGAAGLKLGMSLVAPGSLSRLNALKEAGRVSVYLILGAAVMLLIAAFIEAFWSSSTSIDSSVKYGVGLFLWLVVFAYLMFSGRRHEHK